MNLKTVEIENIEMHPNPSTERLNSGDNSRINPSKLSGTGQLAFSTTSG